MLSPFDRQGIEFDITRVDPYLNIEYNNNIYQFKYNRY